MEYESMVKKRKQENREMLKTLGILVSRQEYTKNKKPDSSKRVNNPHPSSPCQTYTPSRRSSRLLGKDPVPYFPEKEENVFEIQKRSPVAFVKSTKRENVFGAIPEVCVGTLFYTRMEASHAGIHRPPVAGIHGDPSRGCFSLALSGGYEDDVDLGHSFVYTGEGGRDLRGTKNNPKNLRTAPQSKDQVLERGNLALSKNVENNLPVRVLRGYKLRSKYAPEVGYRYDGLYRVVEYYVTTGLSGFSVYKFRLERIENQEPAPWEETMEVDVDETFSTEKENRFNE